MIKRIAWKRRKGLLELLEMALETVLKPQSRRLLLQPQSIFCSMIWMPTVRTWEPHSCVKLWVYGVELRIFSRVLGAQNLRQRNSSLEFLNIYGFDGSGGKRCVLTNTSLWWSKCPSYQVLLIKLFVVEFHSLGVGKFACFII